MWARVKGATENRLLQIFPASAYMFRPGFIQPLKGARSSVRLYRLFYIATAPLFPALRRLFPRLVTTVVHRRGNSTGRLVVRNCAPDCALTGVYPRQTPSLTRRHGERSLGGQVVETTAENVIRYVSTLLQRSAFQACPSTTRTSLRLESTTYSRDRTESWRL